MPKAKRKSSKKVCPKRHAGKKVHAFKGRCYVKTPVKKISRGKGSSKKSTRHCKNGKVKSGARKGQCRKHKARHKK